MSPVGAALRHLAMKGQHRNMTDAAAVVPDADDLTSFFAVCDGHEGDEVLSFCVGKPDTEPCNCQQYEDNMPAVQRTFVRMDEVLELSGGCRESLRPYSGVCAPTKRKSYVLLLLLLTLLSFTPCAKSEAVDIQYCDKFGSQITGFCPAMEPSTGCCRLIVAVMDTVPSSPCLCHTINSDRMKSFGATLQRMVNLYHKCHGKFPADHFTNLCHGTHNASSLAPAPLHEYNESTPTGGENPRPSAREWTRSGDYPRPSAQQWTTGSIVGVTLVSFLVICALVWLLVECCHKKQPEENMSRDIESELYELVPPAGGKHQDHCMEMDELLPTPPAQAEGTFLNDTGREAAAAAQAEPRYQKNDSAREEAPAAQAEPQLQGEARSQDNGPSREAAPADQAGMNQGWAAWLREDYPLLQGGQSAALAARSLAARPSSSKNQFLQQGLTLEEQFIQQQQQQSQGQSDCQFLTQLGKSVLAMQPQIPACVHSGPEIMPRFTNKRTSAIALSNCTSDSAKDLQLVPYDSAFAASQYAKFSPRNPTDKEADAQDIAAVEIFPSNVVDTVPPHDQADAVIIEPPKRIPKTRARKPKRTPPTVDDDVRRWTRLSKPNWYMHEKMGDPDHPWTPRRTARRKTSVSKKIQRAEEGASTKASPLVPSCCEEDTRS